MQTRASLQWRYIGWAVLMALLLVNSAPAPAANRVKPIQGSWASDCLALGKSGRHGLVIRLKVSSDSFDASGQMFAHNTCDVPVISFVNHAVLQPAGSISGHWNLRLTLASATMTINDKSVAALYAQGSKCGLVGWQVGIPVHVEGRTCEPVSYPAKGAVLVAKARTSEDRLMIQDLSALFGAMSAEGVVLPQDVEFHRE